jgi:A/G-specific adenine glycosylase
VSAPLARLRARLLAHYDATRRDLPWRALWRKHADPYHVWVSEIMLQQTVIKAVIPVYARFLQAFPDVEALAAADESAVREAVRGLGYYRRFRFLHLAAKELAAEWARGRSGAKARRWPKDEAGWQALPGIGAYTAAAIASICLEVPTAVLDGNVERVLCRLLDRRVDPTTGAEKKALRAFANELLDRERPGDFNQALMELGQTLCTPTSPACGECPLAFGCLARERGSQLLAPAKKARPAPKDVRLALVVHARADGHVALHVRPEGAKFLKGALGFPTFIETEAGSLASEGGAAFDPPTEAPVRSVRHSITSHRIMAGVVVRRVGASAAKRLAGVTWTPPSEVEPRLVSNLDRKAWHVASAELAKSR